MYNSIKTRPKLVSPADIAPSATDRTVYISKYYSRAGFAWVLALASLLNPN